MAKKAIERDLKNIPAHEELAWAQLNLNKPEDALATANRLVALDPLNARTYLLRSFAYELLGKRDLMLADLKRAGELDARFKDYEDCAKSGTKLFIPGSPDMDSLREMSPCARGQGTQNSGREKSFLDYAWKRSVGNLGISGLIALLLVGLGFGALWRKFNAAPADRAGNLDLGALAAAAGEKSVEKYKLIRLIGQGALGETWDGFDPALKRAVVVKKLGDWVGPQGSASRKKVVKDAKVAAALQHSGLAQIYDILDVPDGLYVAQEHIRGKTVRQMLDEAKRLPLEQVCKLLGQVCGALYFLHDKGIAHRDVKPSNIMVTEKGDAVLLDLGLARGTPQYMAPEAAQGMISHASDIYSLGVCFYEMVTRALPNGSSKPSSVVPELPRQADELAAKALDPGIGTRLRSAKEFQSLLAALRDAKAPAAAR